MSDDLMPPGAPLEPAAPWTKRQGERPMEYAWFVRYAELGEGRTLQRTAQLQGVALSLVRRAALQHQWDSRCAAYDATVVEVTKAIVVNEDEALAMQYAVGIAMMRLGVEAIKLKNPALLKVKQIVDLMTGGAEMARRGAGIADLKIEGDVKHRIEREFQDLLGD